MFREGCRTIAAEGKAGSVGSAFEGLLRLMAGEERATSVDLLTKSRAGVVTLEAAESATIE
jgi:hypothetical protein